MSFRQVGLDLGSAFGAAQQANEAEKKKASIREFVARQLARLPPDKQMEAQALLQDPEVTTPLPASTMMDGVSDTGVPPAISGMQTTPQPVDDLFRPPSNPDLSHLTGPKPDPGEASLRMLLEATRDNIVEPKSLFDYISGMGKQETIGSNRMDVETLKGQVRQELQNKDLQARLDRLEKILENKVTTTDKNNETKLTKTEMDNTTREKVAGNTNASREKIAKETNTTREKVAGGRVSGKETNPDVMTPEEIDAELEVLQQYSDSLSTAATDPKAVGYKPAEEKFATIDEGARQKDLSKTQNRIVTLKAAKARKQVGAGGAEPVPAATGRTKIYTSKADIKADLASGVIAPGTKVQFKMPDGSTVLVNTGK